MPSDKLKDLYVAISTARARAETLNTPASPTRSGELSLAVTKLEEAERWVDRAIHGEETGPERSDRYGEIARNAAGLGPDSTGDAR